MLFVLRRNSIGADLYVICPSTLIFRYYYSIEELGGGRGSYPVSATIVERLYSIQKNLYSIQNKLYPIREKKNNRIRPGMLLHSNQILTPFSRMEYGFGLNGVRFQDEHGRFFIEWGKLFLYME